jgi:hypothetical protein
MSGTLPQAASDSSAWVAEHEVCWELAPVQEFVKGLGMRETGYALRLFGRFDAATQADDEAVARGIFEGLRALVLDALRALPAQSPIEIQPFCREGLPGGPGFIVEVELTAIGSADPDRPSSSAETKRSIALLEARLLAMGLPKRT